MLDLIPLLPFAGFLANVALGKRLSKSVSGGIACAVMVVSFLIAATQVWALFGMPPETRQINQTLYTWITAGDFSLDLAFRLDALSAVMILVITGIGSLIHIYSTAYMHEETDPEYARYFSYLNLFVFFMLLLVLGSNVLVMFVGWEGVGLLRSSAYQAQIYRGAINSIPEGQIHAAFSLGMNKLKAIRHVIVPQMLRLSIPGWSNEFTILLKDTSIVFGIGVIDLMRQGRYIQVRDPDSVLIVYLSIALIYFVLVVTANKTLRYIEKKYQMIGYQAEVHR